MPPAAASTAAPGRRRRADQDVNVYNWSDYIAEDTIPNFEKATGIKVTYDVFDSNEMVETKLLAGSSGYDVVVPSLNFLGRQIQAGVFLPLDKSARSPTYANLDPEQMARIAAQDPGNQYACRTCGAPPASATTWTRSRPLRQHRRHRSWDLVFKPENIAKLKDCGVTCWTRRRKLIPIALNYLGEDPHSFDPAVIDKAAELLLKTIRPYVTNFHSSQYIDDLANGDICLVVGWSGDIIQARDRAAEAAERRQHRLFHSEGRRAAVVRHAGHPQGCQEPRQRLCLHQLPARPAGVAAATPTTSAIPMRCRPRPLMDKSDRDDPTIYPAAGSEAKLFTFAIIPPDVDASTRGSGRN
jgi:putrescine transport system substrate-binding protein